MQIRRLGFWVYWFAVTALIIIIGSGVSADANISRIADLGATNPVVPEPVAVVEPAAPNETPLAEAQPGELDLGVAPAADQVGIASWYGNQHNGRLTASGERFDDQKLTAAHRTLPLATKVRVTNLENGRSIEVKVNDRGPYIPGRVLDLSTQAAKALGMEKEGLALVRIEIAARRFASAAVN
jgi:rare lipoprotein A